MKQEQLNRAREIEGELRTSSHIRKEMEDYEPLRNFQYIGREDLNAKFFDPDCLATYKTMQLAHMDNCKRMLEREMEAL